MPAVTRYKRTPASKPFAVKFFPSLELTPGLIRNILRHLQLEFFFK